MFLLCALAAALPAAPQSQQPAAPQKATLVGSSTCQGCHDEIYTAFQKSAHAVVDKDKRRGWEGNACESCHGAGSIHADSGDKKDILNPARQTFAQADKMCLSCHLNQTTNAGRIQGGHARSQVSCVACHSVHKAEGSQLVLTKASEINRQCASCHPQVWAQFQRPHKHRLPEGAMSCADCHNPHGSFLPKAVRTVAANEPGCLKCHGNLRGPFTYEHSPVRLEGCTTCHQPHGSANPRMLTRHEVRFVCLECHFNRPAASPEAAAPMLGGVPPALHDLRNPRYNNCTICHVKIHGSNVDRALMR
ncbi:MAG: DmsE family decaheme c-type cytochrome [Bryobacteraceae bacterium]